MHTLSHACGLLWVWRFALPSPGSPSAAAFHLACSCRDKDDKISFQEFRVLYKSFPLVVHPLFKLQDAMQHLSLGRGRWVAPTRA